MENILFQIHISIPIKTINEIIQSTEYADLINIESLNKFHIITGKLNPIQQDKFVEKFKERGYDYNGQFIIS
jgi:ribosomal protein L31